MAAGLRDSVATLGGVEPGAVPNRKRWLRTRPILLPLAVLLIAAAGVVAVSRRSSGPALHDYKSGPVNTDSDTLTSLPVEVGQVFTFGGIVLKNFTDEPAVLERIRTDPPLGPELSLVDVKVAGSDRKVGYVGSAVEFPPALIPVTALRPFEGALVPARSDDSGRRGLEVLMGLRVNTPGEFGFRHVLIDYRIGSKSHRVRLNDGFLACAPVEAYPPGCNVRTFFGSQD